MAMCVSVPSQSIQEVPKANKTQHTFGEARPYP